MVSRIIRAVALAAVALAVPHVASATVLAGATTPYSYTPNPGDLYDLDHHYMFVWRIPSVNLSGGTVTGATLTFKNMYNWDSNPNDLFVHLFDTARTTVSGATSFDGVNTQGIANNVSWYKDDPASTVTINDNLVSGQTGYSVLIPTGTANTFIDKQSFPGLGGTPGSVGPDSTGFYSMPSNGSTLTEGRWYYKAGSVAGAYDYTYVFTSSQYADIDTYARAGGDIALGFDPDCHYFNEGVQLNLFESVTGQGTSAVPEPSSLLLLGTGLVWAGRKYRKARQK